MIRSKKSIARRDAFRRLLEDYGVTADQYDAGEEEDPRPFVSGKQACSRFVCVTSNSSSRGYAHPFFLPTFDSVGAAAARAVEFAEDDIFEEVPLEVFDLDTGESWKPDWNGLRFTGPADPFRGDEGAVLIAETLEARGFAKVEDVVAAYAEAHDLWNDFVGPMIDRVAEALFGGAFPEDVKA